MPTLKKGTIIYHGTRWRAPAPKWWEKSFPNKEGEDGGVSFCLDQTSSPKITRAEVVIQYILIQDLDYVVCASKGDFFNEFKKKEVLACWTRAENELSMRLCIQGAFLQYHQEPTEPIWPGCALM